MEGKVLLDDIHIILNKPCEPLVHCDFENGDMCGYHQISMFSDFNWVMLTGALGLSQNDWDVPKEDKTLGTSNGTFLYLDTSKRSEGARSLLRSEVIPENAGQFCFNFYLSMSDHNTATLKIGREDVNFPDAIDIVFEKSGSGGHGWKSHKIDLPNRNYPYTILIEGVSGKNDASKKGHLAIDDIMLTSGKCDSKSSSSGGSSECHVLKLRFYF